MTLRGFHIVFIIISVILTLGLAYYEYVFFQRSGGVLDGALAAAFALVGATLTGYGVWFFRKSRRLLL
ncbi:MAG TPA: hypothetical protein VNQ90_05385 [Chthoniobacteraceae bacterium]|nr:hypothetical protein [Chthoniobacteraceae bacterium]